VPHLALAELDRAYVLHGGGAAGAAVWYSLHGRTIACYTTVVSKRTHISNTFGNAQTRQGKIASMAIASGEKYSTVL